MRSAYSTIYGTKYPRWTTVPYIILQANQYYLPHNRSTNVHRSVNYILYLYILR